MNLGSRNPQHSFAMVPSVNMARSQFDRSFTVKDTFDFDYLVPILVDEVIPGDTANISLSTFARLTPTALKNPVMDNMYIDYFFFFVPSRLVWTNWERFNGAQDDPSDTTDYILPQITAPAVTGFTVGSIYDKMGLPTGIASLVVENALPLRCYNRVWRDWFKDQNLQDDVIQNTDDGPDAVADYNLLKRGKRHDYFTSCLPFLQKGPQIPLPLGDSAPVIGNGKTIGVTNGTVNAGLMSYTSVGAAYRSGTYGSNVNTVASGTDVFTDARSVGLTTSAANSGMIADLSGAAAGTLNQLREAWALQSLFELDARGGTRYVEILLSHFNVVSPDFRLQRAEYLGGGTSRLNSHPVAQTSPTSGSNALGQLGAYGTSSGQGIGFTKSFVEHGYIIGIACARVDITYQQGLHRMWSRSTRFDFFWPKLQELGEQSVLNKEIYAQGTSADNEVFGYQERYAEYRYSPSQIRGEFRSTYATPLDSWHMAEEFSALPVLNDEFIVQSTPIERAKAVTTGPDIIIDMWFQYKHARPMLTYSVPATMGRF